jgi:hypothetical protein
MSSKPISEKRPWKSQSLGVHPKDVKEANEAAKHRGYSHRYAPDGHPIATSKKGRNDAYKQGFCVDPEGGYGDYTGR